MKIKITCCFNFSAIFPDSMLQGLVDFDGYYLESDPCLVCNNPEVPYAVSSNILSRTIMIVCKYIMHEEYLHQHWSHLSLNRTWSCPPSRWTPNSPPPLRLWSWWGVTPSPRSPWGLVTWRELRWSEFWIFTTTIELYKQWWNWKTSNFIWYDRNIQLVFTATVGTCMCTVYTFIFYKKNFFQCFRPGLWHKARKMTLTTGQTDVKVEFPIPIVACNLMIEYADFYDNLQATAETLQCPRCSASVPANPGVCGNCGENVFQCHKCRYKRMIIPSVII